jgi:2-polyprenyl-3-methyl-5-hydroxy-6-metoxy-1,4-benzoquinol methylase
MDQHVSQELVEAGRGYESLFVPALFEQWTKHLIEGAGIESGSQVLDIACGTGVLARRALSRTRPSGRVLGVMPKTGDRPRFSLNA